MRAALRASYGKALCTFLSLAWASSAAAQQQSADQVIVDLNRGAMEAYNNLDINRAGSMLEEALRVAQQSGMQGSLLAQTNLNLAIVYAGGLGDNDGAVRYFADALCADASIQLDPLTSTPDIQSVFQVAAARVQQQGCPSGRAPGGRAPVQAQPNIAPGAAANTLPMEQAPAAPEVDQASLDAELPPGWGQSEPGAGRAKDFRRGFVQLGLTLGMPWVAPGMLADRLPPKNRVFIHSENGGEIVDPDAVAATTPGVLRFPGAILGADPSDPNDVGIQQQNAWEPDRDSYDGYSSTEPFTSSACPGDGKETGPLLPGGLMHPDGLYPSRYCVRVNKPGFAPQLAMRANFGYFVTRDVSLSLLTRLQFSAGKGSLSHLLVGLRAEYMFTKTKARGLMVSGFLGGTVGQIQAQPPTSKPSGDEPWIKSGLQGANIGSNIRYRFMNNFGVFVAPEFDVQFPEFLWNIDLTLGPELAF